MKKMKSFLSFLFVVQLCAFSSISLAEECDQAGAISKMRALSQAKAENINKSPQHQQKYARVAAETAGVGRLLASKNYTEACDKYEMIANKYGIDLEAYEAKLSPLQATNSPTQKKAGECDVISASKKVNGIYPKFKEKLAAETLSAKERQVLTTKLFREISKANPLIQTKPQEACLVADRILTEFGLS